MISMKFYDKGFAPPPQSAVIEYEYNIPRANADEARAAFNAMVLGDARQFYENHDRPKSWGRCYRVEPTASDENGYSGKVWAYFRVWGK